MKDEKMLRAVSDLKDRIRDYSSYQLKLEVTNYKYNFEDNQVCYDRVVNAFEYDYCMRFTLWYIKKCLKRNLTAEECFNEISSVGTKKLSKNLRKTIKEYAKHYLRIVPHGTL